MIDSFFDGGWLKLYVILFCAIFAVSFCGFIIHAAQQIVPRLGWQALRSRQRRKLLSNQEIDEAFINQICLDYDDKNVLLSKSFPPSSQIIRKNEGFRFSTANCKFILNITKDNYFELRKIGGFTIPKWNHDFGELSCFLGWVIDIIFGSLILFFGLLTVPYWIALVYFYKYFDNTGDTYLLAEEMDKQLNADNPQPPGWTKKQ